MININELERITQVYNTSDRISIDDSSRLVLMSDVHRGDGSWADNFSKNQNIYFAAMGHYYKEKYTYVELGDGDELWENKSMSEIKDMHGDAFWMLSRFHKDERLYLLFGNHDIEKVLDSNVRRELDSYYDPKTRQHIPLLKGLKIREGLVLEYSPWGGNILLLHGHQADVFNDRLWRVSQFFVRYLWRPLELYGVNNPTSPARNMNKTERVSMKLAEWVRSKNVMLIAGHTHKAMFPTPEQAPYFNDGSCVFPRCITCIEITEGKISLVKWSVKSDDGGFLYVGRDILAGPALLKDYLSKSE
ncbi:MAG: metallophosphoesterase [Eubacteriales bacterium]